MRAGLRAAAGRPGQRITLHSDSRNAACLLHLLDGKGAQGARADCDLLLDAGLEGVPDGQRGPPCDPSRY